MFLKTQVEEVCGVLADLARFCTHSESKNVLTLGGEPLPAHQDLLRDQKIVDIVVAITVRAAELIKLLPVRRAHAAGASARN